MMLIDSHAHLSTRAFDEDREAVLDRNREEGLTQYVEVGAVEGFDGNEKVRKIAESREWISCTFGLHPHDAKLMNEHDWAKLKELATTHPKCVGIGETGYDFYYLHSPKEAQRISFVEHIKLAKEVGKPLVIHSRDADEATFATLVKEGAFEIAGEFHCYSSDWAFAEKILEKGWMIGLGGVVTFKNAKATHEVAKRIPLESLLIETDSPFLTPVPYRGKRNEPIYVRYVARRIAELKDISADEVAEQTARNAIRFFDIPL